MVKKVNLSLILTRVGDRNCKFLIKIEENFENDIKSQKSNFSMKQKKCKLYIYSIYTYNRCVCGSHILLNKNILSMTLSVSLICVQKCSKEN